MKKNCLFICMLAMVISAFAQDTAKLFLTKPYIQNPANNGMTILWETVKPTYSWVEYGTDTTQLSRERQFATIQRSHFIIKRL